MSKDDWKNSKDVRAARIEKRPEWSWSMDEREFMAPILAERKAKADHIEYQRLKELQARNPYRYKLEMMDKDGVDEKRLEIKDLPAYQARQRAKEGLRAKADAVDSANDPYERLKKEEARAQQAALEKQRVDIERQQTAIKEQARERESAMADVARRYLENPSTFEFTYGKDASAAARTLAKQYLEGQVRKAGGPQVSFAGDAFGGDDKPQQPSAPSAPSGIKGAMVEAGKVMGSLGGNSAASASLGQQGALVAPSAPAAGASRQPAEFNSWEVAKQLHNPNVPEDQKLAMQSSLAPWQKKMVQDSLESYRKLQDDLASAKSYKIPPAERAIMDGARAAASNAPIPTVFDRDTLDVAKDYWLPKVNAVKEAISQNVSIPGRSDGYKPSDFPPANPATSDDEWRKAHVDAVDAENRGMKVRMDNFGRDAINALTPNKSELPPIDPESFGGFDPEKDPAAVARRMLNAY